MSKRPTIALRERIFSKSTGEIIFKQKVIMFRNPTQYSEELVLGECIDIEHLDYIIKKLLNIKKGLDNE